MLDCEKSNAKLTISASGPPKSRNIMRTPSSEDILRRSKGCWRRTLFLTPISSVNSVKPSSMWTPRVHSFPFQLQAARVENKHRLHGGRTTEGNVMILHFSAKVALKIIWIHCSEISVRMSIQSPEFLVVNVTP